MLTVTMVLLITVEKVETVLKITVAKIKKLLLLTVEKICRGTWYLSITRKICILREIFGAHELWRSWFCGRTGHHKIKLPPLVWQACTHVNVGQWANVYM